MAINKNTLKITFLAIIFLIVCNTNLYSQTCVKDTINAFVVEDMQIQIDYVSDSTEYVLIVNDGTKVNCDKYMFDHIELLVPYRVILVTMDNNKTNKVLISFNKYTNE